MYILGISAYYHDSAAALLKDGEISAAAQEERFTRKKHDERFPRHAIDFCLRHAGIGMDEVDYVVFYDKPYVKFERLMLTYLGYAPVGVSSFMKAMPVWLKQKLMLRKVLQRELGGYAGPILFPEHHQSHAASAFFPSPFQEAAVLTVDGVGEWVTTSYGVGKGAHMELGGEIRFPHSLGLLYTAFTYYTGFKVNSGEYKVMGLAPYGEPKYADVIREKLIDLKEDGSFRLDMDYFNYAAGLTMTSRKFHALFGGPPRRPESPVTQKEMDLARSVQVVIEDAMMRLVRHVHKETGQRNLCLAGGVALNCVANGKLLRDGPFENIWIQPAAGDAGGALGAAYYAWHEYLGADRAVDGVHDRQKASLLGPEHSDAEIAAYLDSIEAPYERLEGDALPRRVAAILAGEKVVGWHHGRMEFGPRALGARSILGDPRSPAMQKTMNLKIKYRESFRPFAPSVLREEVSNWFEIEAESPYMLLVAPVREAHRIPMTPEQEGLFGIDKLNVPRSSVPAITHVDYSARIQTVTREANPDYYDLIRAFADLTGVPILINTSFNVRGEPIVCTPQDSYRCFMRTEMDFLVLGNLLLDKTKQRPLEGDTDWKQEFELD